MNVFVLSTGRCGSMTFAKACSYITNYSSAHESRAGLVEERLNYPEDHIEVDNRLSWFLGSLEKQYGKHPLYVHLLRDPEAVARSYAKRMKVRAGIMPAFASGVLRPPGGDVLDAARLMVRTVNDNIDIFLRGKKALEVRIEEPHKGFDLFWDLLGAEGDRQAAHDALETVHNAS